MDKEAKLNLRISYDDGQAYEFRRVEPAIKSRAYDLHVQFAYSDRQRPFVFMPLMLIGPCNRAAGVSIV